jgi:hypothetical protein
VVWLGLDEPAVFHEGMPVYPRFPWKETAIGIQAVMYRDGICAVHHLSNGVVVQVLVIEGEEAPPAPP